jgi:undecaprenyl-diphosphatase
VTSFFGRFGSPPSPALLAFTVLLVVGGFWVLVQVDPFVRAAVLEWRTPVTLDVMSRVTQLGQGWLLGTMGVAVAGIGYATRRWVIVKPGLASVPALIASGLVVRFMKIAFGRPRPRVVDQGLLEWGPSLVSGHNSFPSGHAGTAFAFAAVFSAWIPMGRPFFYAGAVVIALSRIVVDAHFLADVVAGALVGWIVGRVVVVMVSRRWPERGASAASVSG